MNDYFFNFIEFWKSLWEIIKEPFLYGLLPIFFSGIIIHLISDLFNIFIKRKE